MHAVHMNPYSKQNNHNLTITPIIQPLITAPEQVKHLPQPKPPDLTFHCMLCNEFFVNPFHLYQHMNTKHPIPTEETSMHPNEKEEDDDCDYSWVLEPVCELIDIHEKQNQPQQIENLNGTHNTNNNDVNNDDDNDGDDDDDEGPVDDENEEASDSESDDSDESDDSSSSSSSSTSSTSSNSNSQDESTLEQKNHSIDPTKMEILPASEIMEEAAYEEVKATNIDINNASAFPSINLKTADPRESTSIILLNPVANTTITPIVKSGRGRRSSALATLQLSSLTNSDQKCFQCSHCEASFQNAGDLSKHVRSHITNKPFQCSICEKTFTHIGSLNTHIRIHTGEKPYKCDLCGKAFTQSSSLMVHMRSHSVIKPHQCHLCDKGFVNSSSLVLHLKSHAGGIETFTCPECEKEFKLEFMLEEHMRIHTQEFVYQCSICSNAFRSSSELVQHMKCHLGEKPFTCSICDRSFTQSGSLNIHMRIHTGEKPFHCKFCDKSFTQASSLSVHIKIHSGNDKPYPCQICGKAYSQQAYLNRHLQNHKEMQENVVGFNNNSLAVQQQQRPPETLLCIVCGDLHKDTASLAKHVTQKHTALLNDMKDAQAQLQKPNINEDERIAQQKQYMQQLHMMLQMQQQQQQQHMLSSGVTNIDFTNIDDADALMDTSSAPSNDSTEIDDNNDDDEEDVDENDDDDDDDEEDIDEDDDNEDADDNDVYKYNEEKESDVEQEIEEELAEYEGVDYGYDGYGAIEEVQTAE